MRKAGDTRIVILSSTDWDSLKDWIANAPLAPTATPVAEGTPAAEGVDGVALPTTDAAGEDSGAVPDAAGEVAPAVSAPPDDAAPGPTAASPTRP